MDLVDLVVEKTESGIHWHSVEHGSRFSFYVPTPPLDLFVNTTEKVLLLHLTGGSEADLESLSVKFMQGGGSYAYQDDYKFLWGAVVDTSRAISIDPRLETVKPFRNNLRFYGDLRLFIHNRSAYFAGPRGFLGIPLESFAEGGSQESLTVEIIQRTGSTNIRVALPWIVDGCAKRPKVPKPVSSCAYDVFVSHKSEDFRLAKEVYDYLVRLGKKVFLSEESLPAMGNADYTKMIDEALESAKHLVLVGSSIENINSSWVEAEWRMFILEKRSGRKTGNIITLFTGDLSYDRLPISLRYYEAIPYAASSFERLSRYVA